MGYRSGELTSIVGCLLVLATLVLPYALKPTDAVTTYYRWGLLNPLIAGLLAILILSTFIAVHENRLSRQFGTGVGLGLSLIVLGITVAWAATARVDVFLAPGWLLPMQRFILVGFSTLIVLGIGWEILQHDAWTS